MNYICNVNKSPDDLRDYIYIGNNDNYIPDILDYRKELNPIRNQGKQGTCYAQSVSCVKEWQEKKDYGLNEYLSPQFFYNCRSNKYDNNTDNDYGMYGRDVMKLMKNIGICSENRYQDGLIEHKHNISKNADSISKDPLSDENSNTIDKLNKLSSFRETLNQAILVLDKK